MSQIAGCAPRPCPTCPYRRDVPSGIWDREEYGKLPRYDSPEPAEQAPGVFLCHQHGRGEAARLCSGWVGCHGGEHLFALRFALIRGELSGADYHEATAYRSPVPLWESGAAAAEHGLAELERPGRDAVRAMVKLQRRRRDL